MSPTDIEALRAGATALRLRASRLAVGDGVNGITVRTVEELSAFADHWNEQAATLDRLADNG